MQNDVAQATLYF